MKKILFLALSAFTLYACGSGAPSGPVVATPDPANSANQQIAAAAITFEAQSPKLELPQGLEISIRTLTAKGGAAGSSSSINSALEASELDAIRGLLSENKTAENREKALKQLLDDYKVWKEEMKEDGLGWSLEISDTVLLNSPQVVSIMRNTYVFSGGAHPNAWTEYLNFDPATGRRLKIEDIFTDPSAVLPILEKKFQANWAEVLQEGKNNYNNAGFDFENNKFALPKNIGITEKDIVFTYNTYEIAPYVMGPTELTIPKADIINLLKVK